MIKVYRVNLRHYVTSRDLYEAMQLNYFAYARWLKKNVTENELALQGLDYIPIDQPGYKNTYYVNLEFAKELTMMARGRKEGRNPHLIRLRQWMKDTLKQKVA